MSDLHSGRGLYTRQMKVWRKHYRQEDNPDGALEGLITAPAQVMAATTDILDGPVWQHYATQAYNQHAYPDPPARTVGELQYFASHDAQLRELLGRRLAWRSDRGGGSA